MATVTKPVALDESLNTTESQPRNIADVIAQSLASLIAAMPATVLNNLADVVITLPTDGQTLKYDSVSQKWVNADDAGGHTIEDASGTSLSQEPTLQFADADATDDSTNQKTIVNVVRERTQAQYDAMSAADKAKGIIQITDADAKPLFASQVRYGDGTVEDALDSVISPTYGTETPITSYPYTLPSNGYLKATKLTGTYSERYYRLATFGYLSLESSSGNDLRYFTKGVQILSAYGVDLSFIPFA